MSRTERIEVFRPHLGPAELAAASACLRSGWIGRGPKVAEFEQAWAAHLGVPAGQVTSTSCATEALFLVMAWIAASRTGTVVMPANSYIGTANAALAAGLSVKLCDIDRATLNPTLEDVREALTPETVAVVIQHYGGVPNSQDDIEALCHEQGIYLVEDCACAPASMYYGVPSGVNCDFGIWSFDAMKILTCGDGGMLYARDGRAAAELRRATLLGQDSFAGSQKDSGRWWEFQVQAPGRRAVMNDLAAAIGLAQLEQLHQLVSIRKGLHEAYTYRLAGLPWLTVPPEIQPGVRSSYYTFWVECPRRDALAAWLRQQGVYTTYRYWPVHRAYGWPSEWPNTDWAADHSLNLPLHPGLSIDDVAHICGLIEQFGSQHA